jgi:hypothetical protein
MKPKARYYREQAERSRALAKNMLDREVRRHLIDVASEYEKLATEADQ